MKHCAFAVRTHADIPAGADGSAHFFAIVSSIENETLSNLSTSRYLECLLNIDQFGTRLAEGKLQREKGRFGFSASVRDDCAAMRKTRR